VLEQLLGKLEAYGKSRVLEGSWRHVSFDKKLSLLTEQRIRKEDD